MADPSELDPAQRLAKQKLESEALEASLKSYVEVIKTAGETSNEFFDNAEEKNKKLVAALQGQVETLKKLRDSYLALGGEEGVEPAKELQERINALNKDLEKLAKEADNLGKKLSDSLKESIKGYGDLFTKQVIQPITIGATLNAIPALDRLRAEFVKNTGASEKFVNQITKSQGTLKQFGIINQDASKILQGVYLNFNRFGLESETTNQKLIKTAGMFTKLGVPAEQFAKSVSETNTIFGTTTDQAIETQQQLAKTAVALNISIGDMNAKFLSGMKNFAVYGKTGVEQFIKLQTIATATKIELGTLQGITERLTTFEETGAFAGRLNAIVGQDLFDAVTLATLEGAEKADYIRERLREGIDFENISPQMMRAISKASGIEAADLKKLSGEQAGQDIASLQQKAAEAQLESNDELTKTALRATSSQDKLTAAQEAQRNAVIESTGALQAFQGMMGGFATVTGLATSVMPVFASAIATVANIGLPTLQAKLMGTAFPAGGGIGGAGAKAMGMKGLGIGAGLGIVGMGVKALTSDSKNKTIRQGGNALGTAAEYAGIGAAIGSFIPGLGTLAGGVIGGVLGAGMGLYENSKQDVNDFVVTKDGRLKQTGTGTFQSGQPLNFNPGDSQFGTKGGKETAMMANALKELIPVMKEIAGNTGSTAKNTQKSPVDRTMIQNSSMYT